MALIPQGGNPGNPGHKLPPRGASRYGAGGGRSVVFWMHYHIGSRASKQPLSAMTSVDQSQRACARHHYLCARSYCRRMGWYGRPCLHQPSHMASDEQLTHLRICNFALSFEQDENEDSCVDLCAAILDLTIFCWTFASAISYLMLNGSACPIYKMLHIESISSPIQSAPAAVKQMRVRQWFIRMSNHLIPAQWPWTRVFSFFFSLTAATFLSISVLWSTFRAIFAKHVFCGAFPLLL